MQKECKTTQYHTNQQDSSYMNLLFILHYDTFEFTMGKFQYLLHSAEFLIVISCIIYLQIIATYFQWILYLIECTITLESKYNLNYRSSLIFVQLTISTHCAYCENISLSYSCFECRNGMNTTKYNNKLQLYQFSLR